MGRDKLSLYVLNKGTLAYSQAEGQGPPRQISMIVITEATKSKSKKQFQHGVRIGFFSATVIMSTSESSCDLLLEFKDVECFVEFLARLNTGNF